MLPRSSSPSTEKVKKEVIGYSTGSADPYRIDRGIPGEPHKGRAPTENSQETDNRKKSRTHSPAPYDQTGSIPVGETGILRWCSKTPSPAGRGMPVTVPAGCLHPVFERIRIFPPLEAVQTGLRRGNERNCTYIMTIFFNFPGD
jgi:hypothetical protein